ncbi:MAG: DUF1611 domain-containing protein [Sphingomonas sp.]|nr:DUF1611 domain-containing protein [Sphingomonas sp.]
MNEMTGRAIEALLDVPSPYLIFLGDATETAFAKTAYGLRDWAPDRCVGECSITGAITLGLPILTPEAAVAAGAKAMVIGVANIGGVIRNSWLPMLIAGLEAGLDIVSGMHGRLGEEPVLRATAERLGRRLIDVRTPPRQLPVATGRKRTGKRLLTVGTDCALGKKYTALSLTNAFRARNVEADFRATGQTGILIAGSGIPIDAVVADFIAGAAELLSPDNAADHWDVVEGQGSLFHPSYAGVSLGLLHGSQPDVIVMCHAIGREQIMGLEDYRTPSIGEAIELNLALARRVNPAVRCAGIALNTSHVPPERAHEIESEIAIGLGLPVADPMRPGLRFDALVDACLADIA